MIQSVTSRCARAGILSLGILLAAGCASMQQVDCSTADWFAVGLTDGSNGMQPSRMPAECRVKGCRRGHSEK